MRGHRTAKERSQTQENHVAEEYRGLASVSSGAAPADAGDVRATELIECKHRGSFKKPVKSMSISYEDLKKIWSEAVQEGREPAMALRMYVDPSDGHPLSQLGYIDLTLRPMEADRYMRDCADTYIAEQLGRPRAATA